MKPVETEPTNQTYYRDKDGKLYHVEIVPDKPEPAPPPKPAPSPVKPVVVAEED